ncbi:uncharacterized protein Z518_06475 [Rhinocladiella mackenziei CBS 650.93]|uniref:NAD-dependent epimerase/dehydratase domain-containing protein n=1 Tax=Rhinocladiella mackenziei CBS 650.93 TaxID=1442369 RepID=A0A0D2H5C0_9EURO|nr:uncharacterized protein Z518_06475 [Rhinocladiella mackenziei CBS 650.93]KIX05603.1 hypothetical protein Z518_06475 [Rhinocladiella mackenziei CBS 650.93]
MNLGAGGRRSLGMPTLASTPTETVMGRQEHPAGEPAPDRNVDAEHNHFYNPEPPGYAVDLSNLFKLVTYNLVTSAVKGDYLVDKFSPLSKISFTVAEDIGADGAFDAVIHTASPFHNNVTDTRRDILDPAINGTLGILQAAKLHALSVHRVVLTSSVGAMINFKIHPAVYDGQAWNPIAFADAIKDFNLTYNASKRFAELAAWEFVRNEKSGFAFVFGPPLHDVRSLKELNTSNKRILMAFDGTFKKSVPSTSSWMCTRQGCKAI